MVDHIPWQFCSDSSSSFLIYLEEVASVYGNIPGGHLNSPCILHKRRIFNCPPLKLSNTVNSKKTAVLKHFFKVIGDTQCVLLSSPVSRQGTSWKQTDTMRTSKEPPETSKTTKNGQHGKKGDFQRRRLWRTFFKVKGETHSVLDSSHVRVPHRINQRQWGLQRSRQERPKQPKMAKMANSKMFNGDSSFNAPFLWSLEILKVFWTTHMLGYLM